MLYADFENSPAGRLVPTYGGARAFLPNPLPPEIDMGAVALALADATAALGELRGACRRLVNPMLLIGPLRRFEAQTSSAMEGTYTTADKLALDEAGVTRDSDTSTREVTNYIAALSEAIDRADEPITHRTFKALHERLLRDVGRERGEDKRPGEFKRDQNMIGARNLDDARFIPPPPSATLDAISALEAFINDDSRRSGRHPLIDIALVHYQFETIHPFGDGNGRVGRILISLMAITERLLDVPALYLSPELEKEKEDYIDRLYQVSTRGAWEEWINFFLKIVMKSSNRTVHTIDEIIDLQQDYRNRALGASRSANLPAVIDMLFERPVVRARDVVSRLGVTDTAARNLLNVLCEIDVLREFRGAYPAAWIAMDLIELSRPDP